jgi:hypothetical protein
METIQEQNPNNARVFIDYNNKSKARFEYVDKTSQILHLYVTFAYIYIGIFFIIYIGYTLAFLFDSLFKIKQNEIIQNFTQENMFSIIFVLLVIILPLITSLIFRYNKKLIRFMPKINLFIHSFPFNTHYYSKIEKVEDKIVEIPMFQNIFLDYEATEEFSRYLDKVSIVEYPLNKITRNIFNKNNTKIGRKYDYWKAIFEFNEIPKSGYLEIHYL